jgi:hypothetical protein
MLDGFVAGTAVVPAGGVTPPGVGETGVGVAINNVDVGKASRVGVGGTGVEGKVHPAIRTNPMKIVERVLAFIFISSFDNYIAPIYFNVDYGSNFSICCCNWGMFFNIDSLVLPFATLNQRRCPLSHQVISNVPLCLPCLTCQ